MSLSAPNHLDMNKNPTKRLMRKGIADHWISTLVTGALSVIREPDVGTPKRKKIIEFLPNGQQIFQSEL